MPVLLPTVPDAPFNLQLALKREAEGVVLCSWSAPVNAHGLIREFIVSPAAILSTAICKGLWRHEWGVLRRKSAESNVMGL